MAIKRGFAVPSNLEYHPFISIHLKAHKSSFLGGPPLLKNNRYTKSLRRFHQPHKEGKIIYHNTLGEAVCFCNNPILETLFK
jgi:hypothetical protein